MDEHEIMQVFVIIGWSLMIFGIGFFASYRVGKMGHITEAIPEMGEMPDWMQEAFHSGQFFAKCRVKVEALEEETARWRKEINCMGTRIDRLEADKAKLVECLSKFTLGCERDSCAEGTDYGLGEPEPCKSCERGEQAKSLIAKHSCDLQIGLSRLQQQATGCSQCDWTGKVFIKTENGDVVDDVPCPFCRPTNRG